MVKDALATQSQSCLEDNIEEETEEAAVTSDSDRPVFVESITAPEFASGSDALFQQHEVRIDQYFYLSGKLIVS